MKGGSTITNFGDEEPTAERETVFFPDWEWETYDREEDDVYFGRVRSPDTYGRWEYGYFTQDQLEKAGAYHTNLDPDDETPLFPDGGNIEDVAGVYEAELEALLEQRGDTRCKR